MEDNSVSTGSTQPLGSSDTQRDSRSNVSDAPLDGSPDLRNGGATGGRFRGTYSGPKAVREWYKLAAARRGDTETYAYIDTAVGGVSHRNRPGRQSQFHPSPFDIDAFATFLRYPEELLDHVDEQARTTGRGTVSGYRGRCTTDALPFDIDAPTLAGAQQAALHIIKTLHEQYGVPLEAWAINFSGRRGFHLRLPAVLFGGFPPSAELPLQLKRLVNKLQHSHNFSHIDLSVYSHLHLLRVPNTIHSKTGLHAVPLTHAELGSLSPEKILVLARHPRMEWQ